VSWFWLVGAVALSLTPVLIKHRIGGGLDVEMAISALFAIGVAGGSALAAWLSHGRIRLGLLPVAALLMAAFLLDLGLGTLGLGRTQQAITLEAFLASAPGLRIAADVTGLAAAAGLFVVPAFAAAQAYAKEARRARVVAGINILSALFMAGATLATALLQSPLAGLTEPQLLAALGGLNVAAAFFFRTKFARGD
jgi:acyl-[acyl-carrier-protein]-phospholipid O-acyltransferase/long-chain-fatty-acid--[acyl-carrier-protein] ligase